MEALENWKEEKRSAYVYTVLANLESNPVHQKLFFELSKMAEKQAHIWEQQLTIVPQYHPDKRTRFILWMLRYLGAKPLRLMLAAMKVRGMSIYQQQLQDIGLQKEEATVESHHRVIKNSGNLRAAVFGVSDGLLSNASLIFGIAGAGVGQHIILLSGVAGLLAGAFSMGAGEYISVRSQRQMLEYQLELERQELEMYPEEEAQELSFIYQARGLPKAEADKMANYMIQHPTKALDTLAREELGINPSELSSPWGAAFSSFFSFGIGAFIPLLPFILSASSWNLKIAMGLTGLAFFSVGAMLSLFTQRSVLWGGVRMVLIGGAIGLLTNGIGRFFGVSV